MRVRTTQDLGAVIRNRRRHLHLDQASLAARVGVSRQWIVAIERGKPRADVALVLRTLEALGLPLDVDEGAPPARGLAIAPGAGVAPDIDAIVDAARRPPPAPRHPPSTARLRGATRRRARKPRG